jgi:hypothetical protein
MLQSNCLAIAICRVVHAKVDLLHITAGCQRLLQRRTAESHAHLHSKLHVVFVSGADAGKDALNDAVLAKLTEHLQGSKGCQVA